MALRFEARTLAGLMLAAWAQAETVTLAARHDHRKGSCLGAVSITAEGIEYREGPRDKPRKKPHRYAWTWADTQQATLSAKELTVLTYEDRWLKLGADRQMRFALTPGTDLATANAALRQALGRKFVAALLATDAAPLWTLPAKHLHGFRGTLGTLELRGGGLGFRSPTLSRTWTWDDLENVSSAGPYELTLTTFERSRLHYGGRRDFTFQLREPITPAQVDQLWRRITRPSHILTEFTTKEN
ncbi:MAG: hypothetical protein IPJ98_17105 [Bryobacterales bacterium]|nr:hypothetical protein [Bryobacterales bacterium]